MSYTLGITVFDLASIYPRGNPAFLGTLTVPLNGSSTSTIAGGAPTTIAFTTSVSPPTVPGTLLIKDLTGPGDLFRSGPVMRWPKEPASVTAFTLPLGPTAALPTFSGVGRFSYAELGALIASSLPIVIDVPGWATALSSVLTAFQFNPGQIFITAMAFLQSTTGPGIIRAVFGGFIDDPAGENGVNFGGSIDLKPAPSGDASDPTNVLAIGTLNLSLNLDPLAAKLGWAIVGILAPLFSGNLSPMISDKVNGAIASAVAGVNVAGIAPGLTSSWTISARKVTVAASGMSIETIASDLPRPRFLMANVTPQPAPSAVAVKYTVTVDDTITGVGIGGAEVTLNNFTLAGVAKAFKAQTDGNGQAEFNVSLHTKHVEISTDGGSSGDTNRDGKPDREPQPRTREISESPTISITANGYVDLTRPLF